MKKFRIASKKIKFQFNECSLTLEQINEQISKKLSSRKIINFFISRNKKNTSEINVFLELKKKIDTRNINYFNLICDKTNTVFKAKNIKGIQDKMYSINSIIRSTHINDPFYCYMNEDLKPFINEFGYADDL